MKRKCKLLTLILAMAVTVTSTTPVMASAKEITTSSVHTYTYVDSLIPSYVTAKMTTTFFWTYNPDTHKLVDKKDITYSTSNMSLGCFFNNNNTYWAWYDASSEYGTAKGVHSWTFNFGVPTPWGTIGTSSQNNSSALITWQ